MRVTAKLTGGTIKVDAQLLSAIKADARIVNTVRNADIQPYTGNYNGDGVNLQTVTKSYTPSASAQSEDVTPGASYDGLAKVTVNVAAIPYAETANTYGTTVTIG